MRNLEGSVDVALLPVWGWGPTAGHGHLDPPRAAAAIDIIRPASVIPIHWGTFWPIGRQRSDRLVAPPHELIESLGGLDVATDVHLLAPGDTCSPPRHRPHDKWSTGSWTRQCPTTSTSIASPEASEPRHRDDDRVDAARHR